MKQSIEISGLLPKNTRILLEKNFRKSLLQNKKEIADKLQVSINTINAWISGRYNPSIRQLEILGIQIKKIWQKIEEFKLEGSYKKFKLKKRINLTQLSWLAGILDGDRGGKSKDSIGISNQDLKLIKSFMDATTQAFGIEKENFIIEIYCKNNNEIENIIKKLKVNESQIKSYSPSGYKQNKPLIRAIIYSRILSTIMKIFREKMNREVDKGEFLPFAYYVRGLTDSDGGFVRNNIAIQQSATNLKNIKLSEKILNGLSILNGGIKGPNVKNMFQIYIFSDKKNLRRYKDLIGFSSRSKLKKLILLTS